MKLSEVITPTPSPFKAPAAPASPVTANTAVAGNTTSNVANTKPAGSTVSNQQPTAPVTPTKPMPQQAVDALAQVIKSAGLSPSQLNQMVTKAK